MLEKSGSRVLILKEAVDWENLMSFGSVFHSVAAVSEKQRPLCNFVLTDGMHSIPLSEEDLSCLEGA